MKIPFDIKYRPQIESGEYKVETRDGKPTRIVCWDLKGNEDFFILALVEKNGKEISYCYPATGCCKASCDPEGKDDLFIITPEEELTNFEKGLNTFLQDYVYTTVKEDAPEYIKKNSGVLLSLAREQFIKDGYVIENKAEALKDLPRWKKVISPTIGPVSLIKTWHGAYRIDNHIEPGNSFIPLSMLEKLPGFKED